MLYLYVLALGVLSSLVLSVAGLIALGSLLVVGVGVAGAIHHVPVLLVLLKAGAVTVTLQFAYASPLVWPLPYGWSKRWASTVAASLRSWRQ